jgi:hypothetical protein
MKRSSTHGTSAQTMPLYAPLLDAQRAGFDARVVAGIDEAGLGPVLGPLSIGCSAFRVGAARDLWRALAAVASSSVSDDEARLVVADSKEVFTRNARGANRLERTALCFAALAHPRRELPACGRTFVESTPWSLRRAELSGEPWYSDLDGRSLCAPRCTELPAFLALLCAAATAWGVEPLLLGVRLVPVGTLNASFEREQNKSVSHWRECEPFMVHLWNEFADEGVELVVDRHGGRMRYAYLLQTAFPRAQIETALETPERSEYWVSQKSRRMHVVFAEKAETISFQVALASCAAKYARELCMEAFNAYFTRIQPDLKPTAGYFGDGRRWIREAALAIQASGLSLRSLVRER